MSGRTTKAVMIDRYGPPEALVEQEVPLGSLGPKEVQLKVLASGVNFADLLQRAGLYGTVPDRPYTPGFEVAGEVTAVGEEVEEWKPGDSAVAILRFGGYARDVLVEESQLFPYPSSLTPVEAAAAPVVFLTAWVCLFETGHARPGDSVLVLGAGGGVGTAAVQMGVHQGLRVVGTAGDQRKRDFVVQELGAEACFDSRGDWEPDVEALLGRRSLDLALDPVGGKATVSCRNLLGPMGRLVFYGLSEAMPGRKRDWIKAAIARFRTPSIHPLSLVMRNQGVFGVHLLHLQQKEEILKAATSQVYGGIATGHWKPVIDRTFPLDRNGAVAAHHFLHNRENLGKVVLEART
jgi:NADPH:quinone reductase-like Zn-dependent oxidoreductase